MFVGNCDKDIQIHIHHYMHSMRTMFIMNAYDCNIHIHSYSLVIVYDCMHTIFTMNMYVQLRMNINEYICTDEYGTHRMHMIVTYIALPTNINEYICYR